MLNPDWLNAPGTVLLDAARPDPAQPHPLLFRAPRRVIVARELAAVRPALRAMDAALAAGSYVAGYVAYEAGYAFEPVATGPLPDAPLLWLGVYDAPMALTSAAVADGLDRVAGPEAPVTDVRLAVDRARYEEALRTIKAHIQAGDVYQINYTAPLHVRYDGDPRVLYRRLRRRQRVAFGGFLHLGPRQLLCASPELFFHRDGPRLTTRPMKGTVHRGPTTAADDALAAWLTADTKSRAENLMIVDLLRNDLSRVCRPGSVQVPHLFATERYETVTQMTSTVTGRLRPGIGYHDLFAALFPCGSITGAPKRRAMSIIHALEATPRGAYCGAIGYAAPNGRATFNVAIRTVELRDGQGRMGTGSGVVWDSDPAAEYDECRLKTQFLTADPAPPLQLIETMRAEAGAVPLLAYHLDRLMASARYFDCPADRRQLRSRIEATAAALPPSPHKVRLTVDGEGRVALTTAPVSPDASPWTVVCTDVTVDASNPHRFHKTNRRGPYEAAYAQAMARGADEGLLRTADGAVTEGSRTNLFARFGAQLVTPPLSDGVLGGVYRRHVLATHPHATEGRLTPQDLARADALYCCNALRGWKEARLAAATQPTAITRVAE
ncbi:aminodeoxychorismate synthase component I [Salisaeta longa]|uniref:aminodeoxychorismate synthase component I n=1 Tax=Salisaeta longa TaxID=503170 RepID=UPI0003B57E05|nr:aminodeoxychorismate synthase component I [Salisaeta longa]